MQLRTLVVTLALSGLALAPRGLAAESVPPEDGSSAQTAFSVKVSRFGFSRLCRVDVRTALEGLDGHIAVSFDEPLKFALGVKDLDVRIRVLDRQENEVAQVTTRLEDGVKTFTLPLRVPREGSYRLVLEDAGLDASPARARILPDGLATLVFHAYPERPRGAPALASLKSR